MAHETALQRMRARMLSLADRVAHTAHRHRARLRAYRRGRPRRIVVVCHGNICRSPYAAEYLRRELLRLKVNGTVVDSAGLIGPGRPANEQGALVALARGVDLSEHRSRLFRPADADPSTLVLVMTRSQRNDLQSQFGVSSASIELLGDFDTDDPPSREISDPYGHPAEEFKRVFGQIERSLQGLCAIWLTQLVAQASPASDVSS